MNDEDTRAIAKVVAALVKEQVAPLRAEVESLRAANASLATQIAIKAERGEPGKSITVDDVRPLIVELVAEIPRPRNGRDGTDGTSVCMADLEPVVERAVQNRVGKIPPAVDGKNGRDGKDGDSVTLAELEPMIERATQRYVAALPVPVNGRDGTNGVNGTNGTNGTSVALEDVEPVIERMVQKRFAALPAPVDGKNGVNGKDGSSVTLADVEPIIERAVQKRVAALPPAVDGKNGTNGKDGTSVSIEAVADSMFPVLVERVRSLVDDWVAKVRLPKDGKDGRSVTADELAPVVDRVVSMKFAALPAPVDGRNGKNGIDGTSVTLTDVLPLVERLVRAEVSKMPVPQNGRDGHDGKNGEHGRDAAEIRVIRNIVEGRHYPRGTWASFDGGLFMRGDADWECIADGVKGTSEKIVNDRELVRTTHYASGRSEEFRFKLTHQIYRETWTSRAYDQGDTVTWGGSMWTAVREMLATERPGESDGWKMCVKQGRSARTRPNGDLHP